ncbi:MAG: amino acid permease [Chitinophagia bacterium]|nr:amino acid permease [Chitinophagia bacterium]
MANIFRKKTLQDISNEISLHDSAQEGAGLKKVLNVKDLTLMGVAAVIGGGIFTTIGSAAYNGGPGVIFLFVITAITCGFCALCYAEFAARIPTAGSAYTYSYVSFGEVVAWIIGWALILEYAIGNIVVAISWSAYFNNILSAMGLHLPNWLTVGFQTALMKYNEALQSGLPVNELVYTQAPRILGIPIIINLPAFVIVVLVSILAYIGIRESKKTANAMVMVKIAVLLLVAGVGIWYIFSNDTASNWSPFLPNGMSGVLKGVSAVFFAYIGFDAVSTTAEECANPQRDMPKGMIYSLIICTVIYIVTALVITGMVNYAEFENVADPLAFVFEKINMQKFGFFISLSAVLAATSVLLVFQIGQPRIWMAMSRDGLLPSRFSKVSPTFKTPGFSTFLAGALVAGLVLVIDDKLMTDLTSIGTLFAFVLVSGGVLLLPKLEKQKGRFSIPYINAQFIFLIIYSVTIFFFRNRISNAISNFGNDGYQEILFLIFILLTGILTVQTFRKKYSLIPVLGVASCLYLMVEIPAKSWVVFFGWMTLGLIIYFSYGKQHSRLNK